MKAVVSSIVALALAITPAYAMAAEKNAKPAAAHVSKHKKPKAAKIEKGKDKEKPVVTVGHKKDKPEIQRAGHHAEPHKGEPQATSSRNGALVPASLSTKKADKKLEAKPSKQGREKGAKKSTKKPAANDAASDGQPERDEDFAELVARIRGNGSQEVREVKGMEPAPKKETVKSKTLENAKCWKDAVEVARGSEVEKLTLKKCDGTYAPNAIEHLSVLVRPPGTDKPTASYDDLAKKKGPEIAKGIRRVDPRLVDRLQLIVDHFGKKGSTQKIDVVSGYRPASQGSMHQTGRAMDFRLEGIDNEKVVAFCKTLDDTGCGFYPNSKFVHVDVREPGSGHVSWIDASGPGESPKYVTEWPPKVDKGIEKTSAITHDQDGPVEITEEGIPQLPK